MIETNEIWKPITYLKGKSTKKYAVSNIGRIASYDTSIEDLRILKLTSYDDFPRINIKINNVTKAIFPQTAVANCFIKKTNALHTTVIHLDNNRHNNTVENLKWVTLKEHMQHVMKSPSYIKKKSRKIYTGNTARKLDEKKIIALKKELWNKNRKVTLEALARTFGISQMSLYRIKSGENWWHVRVEGEPTNERYKQQQKVIELNKKDEAKENVLKAKKLAISDTYHRNAKIRRAKLETEKKQRALAREKKKKAKAAEAVIRAKKAAKRAELASKRRAEKAARSANYKLVVAQRKADTKSKKKMSKNKAKSTKATNFTLVKLTKKKKKK